MINLDISHNHSCPICANALPDFTLETKSNAIYCLHCRYLFVVGSEDIIAVIFTPTINHGYFLIDFINNKIISYGQNSNFNKKNISNNIPDFNSSQELLDNLSLLELFS